MDDILKLNFGFFNEHKIKISEIILNFIIEVENGQIQLKHKDEKGEEIEGDNIKVLIKYINEKLNIDKNKITKIIDYLLENGLKNIIINKLNEFLKYPQKI